MCGCAERRQIILRAAGHVAGGRGREARADAAAFAASLAADLSVLRDGVGQRLAAARARLAGRR